MSRHVRAIRDGAHYLRTCMSGKDQEAVDLDEAAVSMERMRKENRIARRVFRAARGCSPYNRPPWAHEALVEMDKARKGK